MPPGVKRHAEASTRTAPTMSAQRATRTAWCRKRRSSRQRQVGRTMRGRRQAAVSAKRKEDGGAREPAYWVVLPQTPAPEPCRAYQQTARLPAVIENPTGFESRRPNRLNENGRTYVLVTAHRHGTQMRAMRARVITTRSRNHVKRTSASSAGNRRRGSTPVFNAPRLQTHANPTTFHGVHARKRLNRILILLCAAERRPRGSSCANRDELARRVRGWQQRAATGNGRAGNQARW